MTEPRARNGGAAEPAGKLVNAGEIDLAWGRAAEWKAYLRDESLRRHLDRPLGDRLRSALSLVLADDRTREPRST